MNRKTKNAVDLILNLLIVLSTLVAVGFYFVSGPDVLGSFKSGCFKYFTTDSNVLAAISSAVMLVFNIRRLKSPEAPIPKAVHIFKFVGTVSVTITLVTVVLFLAPVASLRGGLRSFLFFFEGNVFALHFSTPVLAIASLLLFEEDCTLKFKDLLWAMLPTVAYSLVYLVMVVFVKGWTDWYGFTFGGRLYMAPVSMLAMYLLTLVISLLLGKRSRNACSRS